jgi:hypothetical protein
VRVSPSSVGVIVTPALIERASPRGMRRMAWPATVSYQSSASAAPACTCPSSRSVIVGGDALAPTWMAGAGVGVGVRVGVGGASAGRTVAVGALGDGDGWAASGRGPGRPRSASVSSSAATATTTNSQRDPGRGIGTLSQPRRET